MFRDGSAFACNGWSGQSAMKKFIGADLTGLAPGRRMAQLAFFLNGEQT
jgi:hypothetical protein